MKFEPGCYEAQIKNPAQIKAKVKVSANRIENVSVSSYGQEQEMDSDLQAMYRGQILQAQSVNIDGITSASILNKAVKSAVGQALAKAIKRNEE